MKRKTKDGAHFLVGNALVGWRRQRDREKKIVGNINRYRLES